MAGGPPETICPAAPGITGKLHKLWKNATTEEEKANAAALFSVLQSVLYTPGAKGTPQLMKCISDMYATGNVTSCGFGGSQPLPTATEMLSRPKYPGTEGMFELGAVLGMDLAGRLTEESLIEWWRAEKEAQPLGISRTLVFAITMGSFPAIPRPQPPVGNSLLSPLVIGNLFDGQTPYKNAQRMVEAFPSGRLLTTQFYGHCLQGPSSVKDAIKKYEDEIKRGEIPTYDDDVAKLLCVKVALEYLKYGTLCERDHVCKAAGPVQTGPGTTTTVPPTPQAVVVI